MEPLVSCKFGSRMRSVVRVVILSPSLCDDWAAPKPKLLAPCCTVLLHECIVARHQGSLSEISVLQVRKRAVRVTRVSAPGKAARGGSSGLTTRFNKGATPAYSLRLHGDLVPVDTDALVAVKEPPGHLAFFPTVIPCLSAPSTSVLSRLICRACIPRLCAVCA